jgi:hypothetical protein
MVLNAFPGVDECAVCDCELLCTFVQSLQGTLAQRMIVRQNPEHFSILPAIGMNRVLAVTVQQDNFNCKKYEHFLKYDLVRSVLKMSMV